MTYVVVMEEYEEGKVIDTITHSFDLEEDREEFAQQIWRCYTMISEANLEDGFGTGWIMTYQ